MYRDLTYRGLRLYPLVITKVCNDDDPSTILLLDIAGFELRKFVLTRTCVQGKQRYPVVPGLPMLVLSIDIVFKHPAQVSLSEHRVTSTIRLYFNICGRSVSV